MPRSVDHRLARRRHERARLELAHFADRHDLDAHGVLELELARDRAQLGREVAREGVGSREEPIAQLALLRAGDAGDLGSGSRAVLDDRESLQHGVMQVRGDLGALLLSSERRAFGRTRRRSGDERRHGEARDAEQHERDADDRDERAGVGERRGKQCEPQHDEERGCESAHDGRALGALRVAHIDRESPDDRRDDEGRPLDESLREQPEERVPREGHDEGEGGPDREQDRGDGGRATTRRVGRGRFARHERPQPCIEQYGREPGHARDGRAL